jgi:hypothetical protein
MGERHGDETTGSMLPPIHPERSAVNDTPAGPAGKIDINFPNAACA